MVCKLTPINTLIPGKKTDFRAKGWLWYLGLGSELNVNKASHQELPFVRSEYGHKQTVHARVHASQKALNVFAAYVRSLIEAPTFKLASSAHLRTRACARLRGNCCGRSQLNRLLTHQWRQLAAKSITVSSKERARACVRAHTNAHVRHPLCLPRPPHRGKLIRNGPAPIFALWYPPISRG